MKFGKQSILFANNLGYDALIPFNLQPLGTLKCILFDTIKMGCELSKKGVIVPHEWWDLDKADFLETYTSTFEKIQSDSTHLFMDQIQSNLTWKLFDETVSHAFILSNKKWLSYCWNKMFDRLEM